jgi:phage terminase Nu1 subunit (DNA packaging protein)
MRSGGGGSKGAKPAGSDVNELAKLLGVTPRRVQQLVDEGVVVRLGRGQYDAIASNHNYIKYWQDRAEGRAGASAQTAVQEYRAEILRMELEDKRLELARKYGELVDLDHMEKVLRGVVSQVGRALDNMAGLLAPQVAEQPAPECFEVIDGYVEDTKERLRKAFEEAMSGEEDGGEEGPGEAADVPGTWAEDDPDELEEE